jgi:lysophospholipase L1-like esterase
MTAKRLVLAGVMCAALAACSTHKGPAERRPAPLPEPGAPAPPHDAPPPPPDRQTPPPAAALPDFRTGGGLLARHQRIVDEARKGGHEIAFLGDSITEGWAGAGRAEWERTWAPRHAINCGIGGDRTQHVLGRLDHGLLEALSAPNNDIKWVVLMIGTNNTGSDNAEQIAAGIRAIVDELRRGLPSARILLINVFPRGEWPNPLRDTIDAVNVRIAGLIDGVHVVGMDLGPKFLRPDGELPASIMPDYLHPSAAGYAIWSEALRPVVLGT